MHAPRKLALRRARARRRSLGAAMFIVAVTLGLLAAMGVYGLAATAYDVRAAGHGRAAAQGQHAAELAVQMTASMLTPGNARSVLNEMQFASGTTGADATTRKTFGQCTTAKPFSNTDLNEAARARAAEACLMLTPVSMKGYAQDPANYPSATAPITVPFDLDSFGEVATHPTIRVELTNPIDWSTPAGYSISGGTAIPVFTSIRVTVFVEMRPDATTPADFIATGRGRLIVGPYMQ